VDERFGDFVALKKRSFRRYETERIPDFGNSTKIGARLLPLLRPAKVLCPGSYTRIAAIILPPSVIISAAAGCILSLITPASEQSVYVRTYDYYSSRH